MNDYVIVAIGYNRPDCMRRLLDSLEEAYYSEAVDLVVSIDNSGNDNVEKVAESFRWTHGEKKVVTSSERLGLKKHILSCGKWTEMYKNVIVFEDDLFVSKYFFTFVKEAVEKYQDDDRIAGIGLYNYDFCQNSGYPFSPINDGNDVYFIQHACSWGQVWIKEKWNSFLEWYNKNTAPFNNVENIPKNVNNWNENSWLKYHVRYCIDNEKFFVYPFVSLSTNFSSKGSHNKKSSNRYQVALLDGKKTFCLPSLDESRSVYDAFFENKTLGFVLRLNDSICVDTYGVRENSGGKRYWLTTKPLPFPVIKSFGLELRPREANVILDIPGDVIKLYDTMGESSLPKLNQRAIYDAEIEYAVRDVSLKKLIHYCISECKRKLLNR